MTEVVPLPYLPADVPDVPAETLATVYEFPAAAETGPQPATGGWRSLRRGFNALRQSVRVGAAEAKAIGHLAALDLKAAHSTLANLQPIADEQTDEPVWYEPASFKQRVVWQADYEASRRKYERRHKLREIKRKTGWTAATIGAAALAGYVSAEIITRYL